MRVDQNHCCRELRVSPILLVARLGRMIDGWNFRALVLSGFGRVLAVTTIEVSFDFWLEAALLISLSLC